MSVSMKGKVVRSNAPVAESCKFSFSWKLDPDNITYISKG